eukprot:gene1151-1256_t
MLTFALCCLFSLWLSILLDLILSVDLVSCIVERKRILSMYTRSHQKVEIVFKEDGNKFLDLSGVPDLLKQRSGLTTYLYLRDCYDDLFEDISSCVSQDIPGMSKTIAILGTEGIGKSALFLVILKKLLDAVVEIRSGYIVMFVRTNSA